MDPERSAGGVLRALRQRPFALLWTGQTLSRVGDFVYEVALAWWVLQVTGSAAVMGSVLVVTFLPMLLLLLVGGVAVDRLHRPRLMIASDLARAAVVLGVAALAFADRLEVWHVYIAALVFGLADAFFQPAYAALVPQLVPKADLPSANSLTSVSAQAGRIAGPALGGLIVAALGAPLAFGINGLSFLVSAAFLLPLAFWRSGTESGRGVDEEVAETLPPEPILLEAVDPVAPVHEVVSHGPAAANPAAQTDLHAPAEPGSEADAAGSEAEAGSGPGGLAGFWAEVREGWGTVAASPILWLTIAVMAVSNVTLAGPYSVTMPFLVDEVLGGGPRTLGFLYACFPVGYLVAAVWLGARTRLRRRGAALYLGLALAGLMLAVFGFAPPLYVLAAAAFVNGFALELAGLAWVNTLQERVPNEMLGRVSSIDSLGSFALLPLGFALAGWATDAFGPDVVFVVGGLTTALVAALAFLNPTVRRFD